MNPWPTYELMTHIDELVTHIDELVTYIDEFMTYIDEFMTYIYRWIHGLHKPVGEHLTDINELMTYIDEPVAYIDELVTHIDHDPHTWTRGLHWWTRDLHRWTRDPVSWLFIGCFQSCWVNYCPAYNATLTRHWSGSVYLVWLWARVWQRPWIHTDTSCHFRYW